MPVERKRMKIFFRYSNPLHELTPVYLTNHVSSTTNDQGVHFARETAYPL